MELIYVLEYRFRQAPDGSVWTDTSYERLFWQRYLDVFAGVTVVARALRGEPGAGWRRVDGEGVRVAALPHYLGAVEYCRRKAEVAAALGRALATAGGPTSAAFPAVILRIPSQLANLAAGLLAAQGRPFGVEVVGDPREALGGISPAPFRPALQWWFGRQQALECRRAATAAYVSRHLRERYPPGPDTAYRDCSDVALDGACFRAAPRRWEETAFAADEGRKGLLRLVTVATLAQKYKGIDVLLHALAKCVAGGLDAGLTIVGDGRYRAELEGEVAALGLQSRVRFTGALGSGDPVREELDRADLFILPSRTEGMPRAVIEAMARGLPVIATRVGGVPELLPPEDLVAPGDAAGLAAAIGTIGRDARRRNAASARNLAAAGRFRTEVLSVAWRELQTELKQRTARCCGETRVAA